MADPEHLELVKQGAESISAWRKADPEERLVLSDADLSRADLRSADLRDAYLSRADLRDAYLSSADLRSADLSSVNLRSADLRYANLSYADLRYAYLSVADLRYANLSYADLSYADLRYADFTGAIINRNTKFDDVYVNGETKGLGPWIFNPEKFIIREIEFPPEYRQAGISIMNYFAEIMRQKYPDIPATVQITQDDLTVRMTIETDDGHRETVEKTLEVYGLVVAGKQQPNTLVTNQTDIFRLESELRMAAFRLENEQQLRQIEGRQHEQRIESLESEVAHLRQLVGGQLQHVDRLTEHAGRLADILDAQVLASLQPLLARGLTEADEPEAKRILTDAEKKSPGTLQRITEGTTSEVAGSVIGDSLPLLLKWAAEVGRLLGL